MAVEVRIARANAITSDGPDQDFTVSGWSGTPKAAIFVATFNTNDDGGSDDHAAVSYGFTDGTSQASVTVLDECWAGTSDNYRRWTSDEVIQIISNKATYGEANFKEWISGGVRVTWGDLPGTAIEVTVYLFSGDDLSAKVGSFTNNATEDGTVDVDCGFEPDQVIFATEWQTTEDTAGDAWRLSLGVADNGDSITQKSITTQAEDNVGTTENLAFLSTNRIATLINPAVPNFNTTVELTAFGSNGAGTGFTGTTRDGTTQANICYLALKYDNQSHWLGTFTSPLGTGNQSYTDPGFKPRFVFLLGSVLTTSDTIDDTDQFSVMVGGFNESEEYCDSASSEDDQGTSDTQSVSNQVAIACPADSGGGWLNQASYVSMDSTGYTLNWTQTNISGCYFIALAISILEIKPGAGTLTTTGQVPTFSSSVSVEPTTASSTISGQVPNFRAAVLPQPAVVGLTLVGNIPDLKTSVSVVPGTATLTIIEQVPSSVSSPVLQPSIYVSTLTGYAPNLVIGQSAQPGIGSVVVTGQLPTVGLSVYETPNVGTISTTGYIPTLNASVVVFPNVAAITVTGQQGVFRASVVETPDTDTTTASGLVPTTVAGVSVLPETATLTITGQVPVISAAGAATVQPANGIITATGQVPSLRIDRYESADTSSVSITGQAATTVSSVLLAPTNTTLTLSTLQQEVVSVPVVQPDLGTLTATTYNPTVLAAGILQPNNAEITALGYTPTVVTAQLVSAQPDSATLTIVGQVPTTVAGVVAQPSIATITVTEQTVGLNLGQILAVDSSTITITGQVPTVVSSPVIQTTTGSLAITGYEVVPRIYVTPAAGTLSLVGYKPNIALGDSEYILPEAASITITTQPPTLSIVNSLPTTERTAYVAAEDRTTVVSSLERTSRVDEDRTIVVPQESRTSTVAAEDRTVLLAA